MITVSNAFEHMLTHTLKLQRVSYEDQRLCVGELSQKRTLLGRFVILKSEGERVLSGVVQKDGSKGCKMGQTRDVREILQLQELPQRQGDPAELRLGGN